MPSSSITPSAAGLRALSHPTRMQVLGILRVEGPSTATALAHRLGLNTGATSYHLRQLAEHGFIVEDSERGDARDRWWKAAHDSTRASLLAATDEEAESAEAYLRTVALMYTESLMQAAGERLHLPQAWQRAGTMSDWQLRLTPARAEQLTDALADLIEQWSEEPDDEDADAATFVINLNSFPRPGTVLLEDDPS